MSLSLKKIVADNLKKIRNKTELSQIKFAELCNVDSNTISNIERAQTFSIETIENIANVLNIHPKEFFEPVSTHNSLSQNEIVISLIEIAKNLKIKDLRLLFGIACLINDKEELKSLKKIKFSK